MVPPLLIVRDDPTILQDLEGHALPAPILMIFCANFGSMWVKRQQNILGTRKKGSDASFVLGMQLECITFRV